MRLQAWRRLTTTIKSYLRELPEPLFNAELYPDWLEASRLDDNCERFDLVWSLLQHEALLRENYRNIQYLCRFLHEVSKLEERNKMSPSNLAIVITPNVVSNESDISSLSGDISRCCSNCIGWIMVFYAISYSLLVGDITQTVSFCHVLLIPILQEVY